MTPKRPEATCLIAERRESPFGSRTKRTGSSPPSPVLERPPIRFIAIASVSCASREIEPSDIAPVAKRLTISAAGSTSSIEISPLSGKRKRSSPRNVERRAASSFTACAYCLVRREAAVADGVLQERDRLRVPLVMLTVAAPGIEADDRKQLSFRAGVRTRVAGRGSRARARRYRCLRCGRRYP